MNHHKLAILLAQYVVLLPLLGAYLWRGRRRGARPRFEFPRPLLVGVSLCFVAVVLPLSAWWSAGILWGDEAAYRFQADAYAAGHLGADAPPPTSADPAQSERELRFAHHIVRGGKWFTKYPPLWPAVLAVGRRLNAGWIVNPILALLAALLVRRIAEEERTLGPPGLAVVLMLASPYFFLMAASEMSHMLAMVLILVSTRHVLRSARTGRAQDLALTALSLAACAFVRPFTAVCAAVPIACFAAASQRHRASRLVAAAAIGGAGALLVVFGMAAYNKAFTGSYWVSPYALYRGTATPVELSLSVKTVLANLRTNARWSIEDTVTCAFPFMYLLALYAVVADRENLRRNLLLAGFTLALWGGHLFNTEGSASRFGDRYLFESLFGAVLLGSRGLELLYHRLGWAASRLRNAFGAVLGLQAVLAAALTIPVLREIQPYVRVHRRLAELHPGANTLVYLAITPSFTGDRFNLNTFDWRSRPLVLVDPGTDRRESVAREEGRPNWFVMTYDETLGAPRVLASSDAQGGGH